MVTTSHVATETITKGLHKHVMMDIHVTKVAVSKRLNYRAGSLGKLVAKITRLCSITVVLAAV